MTKIVNKVQQLVFILLGITIPTTIAGTNMVIGLLALLWILEGNFKNKFNVIKSSKWILSIFALIGFYALGMLWGDIHLNADWQFQRLALWLVFPVLGTMNLKQETIRDSVVAFLITTFISAIISIAINNNIILPIDEYFSFINYDWSISAFVKYNYHNVLLSLAFTISLYVLIEKKSKYKVVLVLFIIAYAISIFTERGRAGQVIFNLSAISHIVYYNRKYLLKMLALLILLFSFQFIVYKMTKVFKNRFDEVSNIIKNNVDRGEGHLEDIRYVFIKESLSRIKQKPILGYGTGSFGTIFDNEVKSGHDFQFHRTPHNQYLYVLFELGILGLLLLLSIFYYQIKALIVKKDGIHRVLLPLSFIFLMLVDSYFFIFILTIAYIFLYTIYSRYESE